MNDEIVIRIPSRVLRELIAAQDHAEDAEPTHDEPAEAKPWSDKQKRYVYRLLQRLGHEGEAAKRYITAALRLNGSPPTRGQASSLIDRLHAELAEGKEARDGAA